MAEGMASMGWMSAAGSLLQAYGNIEAGKTARAMGEMAKMRAEFAAWQAEQQGKEVIAAGQRQALEEERKAGLLASRAIAVAASSGGGVSDPTIVNLLARTKGEGVYRASVALYEGEAKARQLRFQAAAGHIAGSEAVVEGISSQMGHTLAATGDVLRAGSKVYARSLYEKYGLNGPQGGKAGDSALLDGSFS